MQFCQPILHSLLWKHVCLAFFSCILQWLGFNLNASLFSAFLLAHCCSPRMYPFSCCLLISLGCLKCSFHLFSLVMFSCPTRFILPCSVVSCLSQHFPLPSVLPDPAYEHAQTSLATKVVYLSLLEINVCCSFTQARVCVLSFKQRVNVVVCSNLEVASNPSYLGAKGEKRKNQMLFYCQSNTKEGSRIKE